VSYVLTCLRFLRTLIREHTLTQLQELWIAVVLSAGVIVGISIYFRRA
jgi:hypothetical protein